MKTPLRQLLEDGGINISYYENEISEMEKEERQNRWIEISLFSALCLIALVIYWFD